MIVEYIYVTGPRMTPEQLGYLVGALIGSLLGGAVCGLVPLGLAIWKQRTPVGVGAFATCVICGLILGLALAGPVAILFTAIVLFLGRTPVASADASSTSNRSDVPLLLASPNPFAAPQASTPLNHSDMPFFLILLLALFVQLPVWLVAGLGWSLFMMAFAGSRPLHALIGGIGWGASMWVLVGGVLSIGLAWRRSAAFIVQDRVSFRALLDEVCRRSRLVVLDESADRIVLGPKWVVTRFRIQEAILTFEGNTATLTASALSLPSIRKKLHKALAAAKNF